MDKKFGVFNSAGISIQYFESKQEAEQKAKFWKEYHGKIFLVNPIS